MDLEKGCPFCGKEVQAAYVGSSDWEVECDNCNYSVFKTVRNKGINEDKIFKKWWNTRAEEK